LRRQGKQINHLTAGLLLSSEALISGEDAGVSDISACIPHIAIALYTQTTLARKEVID